jgi:membrane protein required for colicin V production
MGWPDVIVAIIVLIAAFKGYRAGLLGELSGAIALVLALVTPWFYNGSLDGLIEGFTHLGPGSAHVIAMFLVALLTYLIVIAIAFALRPFARLPVLGFGNSLAGGLVGILKGMFLGWFVLYVVLFFPLSSDIHNDLRRSPSIAVLNQPNQRIDDTILGTFPWLMRPFVSHFFKGHQL